MYPKYKPIFAGLDIHNTDDIKKSVQYFREMTAGLSDSHFNLTFAAPIVDSFVNPSSEKKSRAGSLGKRYVFYDYDAAYYFDKGYTAGTDSINFSGPYLTRAVSGTIDKNILYLGFNQFNLKKAYESPDNGVKRALQFFINKLRNPSDLKGLIIDVRGNSGGSVADLNFLIGNMISSKLTIGYTRYKSGNGRLDYTPWSPAVVTPQPDAVAMPVPVIAITDRFSGSMAEITAVAIHSMKYGKTAGEQTWGAMGALTSNQVFNGGQFSASGFVNVYTSSSMFKYIDGNIYEGKGFPADCNISFNLTDNCEKQLEKAISLLWYALGRRVKKQSLRGVRKGSLLI